MVRLSETFEDIGSLHLNKRKNPFMLQQKIICSKFMGGQIYTDERKLSEKNE